LKKLPIGISTFKKIREENYIYVDKTKEILDLIQSYEYVFLSRPRRFGKSLFLDTLKEVFEGNKELFKGLYIYDKYDFEPHPVIKISWAGYFKTLDSTKKVALTILRENQKKLDVYCEEQTEPSSCFAELIRKTYEKYNKKVVILIDEYDKPIIDNIEDIEIAKQNREFLRGFYTVIKDSDAYVRFAFLTGVSKFSKVSIFSGLNNLVDISLNPKYYKICGYTHNNLLNEFKEHLEGADLEEVREWYNGYNFLGKEKVYNPFDILLFIDSGLEFNNYWFKTATPTFLIKLLEKRNYDVIKFENLEVGESILDSFDITKIKLESLLFQTGYLTIKKKKKVGRINKYILTFPNLEVRSSFNDFLLDYLTDDIYIKETSQDKLYTVLYEGNLEKLEEVLRSIYSSVPYHYFTKNKMYKYENYYVVVLYMYMAGLGLDVIPEDITNSGRIDLTVKLEDKTYIFEFKVSEEKALEQIKDRKYYQKYLDSKEIYIVGIIFDDKEKNVKSVVWEKVK